MRIPALTAATRAQRQADVLAQCITLARTAEDAARFRQGYHVAAEKAASLTRTDISRGWLPLVLGTARSWLTLALAFARRHPRLVALVLVVVATIVFRATAPAAVQNDVKWLATGIAVGVIGAALYVWRSLRNEDDWCQCPGCDGCDE